MVTNGKWLNDDSLTYSNTPNLEMLLHLKGEDVPQLAKKLTHSRILKVCKFVSCDNDFVSNN